MFYLFLTPSFAAVVFDAFVFDVEKLTLNGTSHVAKFDNETLYYNYMGPVARPSECTRGSDTVAVTIAEDYEDEDRMKCYPHGLLSTVKHSLIQDKPFHLPKGIRTTYDNGSEMGASLVFEILCSRVDRKTVKRFAAFDYRVTWYHPAGCPRPNIMKPSRFDRI
ncbi:hypothetical protein BLNAU_12303 [Blattamonas nauphoetae]|uniref:Uncharacterized protein n=1 Tax=Blattamonas nauphoetae TaxID=2049346 RepID=A0ABQ9XLN4_9EUKA|nr:hypothetical protein BLNAU_12303 [Blattamonas nauphoetae]